MCDELREISEEENELTVESRVGKMSREDGERVPERVGFRSNKRVRVKITHNSPLVPLIT